MGDGARRRPLEAALARQSSASGPSTHPCPPPCPLGPALGQCEGLQALLSLSRDVHLCRQAPVPVTQNWQDLLPLSLPCPGETSQTGKGMLLTLCPTGEL